VDGAAFVLPGEPVPVRLMNTVRADRGGVHDALTTPGDLRAGLAAVYPDVEPHGADLDRFRALRDALRRLAALVTGDHRPAAASAHATTARSVTKGDADAEIGADAEVDDDAADGDGDVARAVAEVNAAAALAPSWPQLVLRDGGLRRTVTGAAGPGERLLSGVAREAVELFTGEHHARVRACYAPGCVLYFVQDPPRREWCSTACGNRARAARHYDRHHRQGPAAQ
jgi:predicted RNA-binding Zn ribbon-like protein